MTQKTVNRRDNTDTDETTKTLYTYFLVLLNKQRYPALSQQLLPLWANQIEWRCVLFDCCRHSWCRHSLSQVCRKRVGDGQVRRERARQALTGRTGRHGSLSRALSRDRLLQQWVESIGRWSLSRRRLGRLTNGWRRSCTTTACRSSLIGGKSISYILYFVSVFLKHEPISLRGKTTAW